MKEWEINILFLVDVIYDFGDDKDVEGGEEVGLGGLVEVFVVIDLYVCVGGVRICFDVVFFIFYDFEYDCLFVEFVVCFVLGGCRVVFFFFVCLNIE